jgi:hypothetical protein
MVENFCCAKQIYNLGMRLWPCPYFFLVFLSVSSAMVYNLVKERGGNIGVNNKDNGVEFLVSFPFKSEVKMEQ